MKKTHTHSTRPHDHHHRQPHPHETLAHHTHRPSHPLAPKKKKFHVSILYVLFYTLIIFAIGVIFFALYLFEREKQFADAIYPHVYIGGIHVGGKTTEELERYFTQKNDVLGSMLVTLQYKDEAVATFSGKMIDLHYDTKTIINHVFSIGRSPLLGTRMYQKIKSFFNFGGFYFPMYISYDLNNIKEYLDLLEEQYNKPAENALFQLENGKVTAFKEEKKGVMIRTDETLKKVEDYITQIQSRGAKAFTLTSDTKMVIIPVAEKILEPEVSLSSINTFGIVEKIGEGISDFSGSIPGRVHNIIVATSKLHGAIVPKDTTFSFNDTVGDISAATGYKPAYIIKSGRTVLGDGGGVCQVSTTIFRAALNSGLPITDRSAHAYRVHYYEQDSKPGFDATVFAPSTDFKFKNNTPAAILIQATVDQKKNSLLFTFYGKKDGRSVEISDVKLWDVVGPPSPAYQDDPTLKKGVKKQVDWSAPGGKASFYYKVMQGEETIFEKTFFSNYRPWRAVYLLGTAE
ncbi:MAG TPA: VanW family protein [Patescibacteria group bacterium]|nr:VanW family protein [Patescibacteria group bacterium]